MDIREGIRRQFIEAGALAVGFANAGKVTDSAALQYSRWLAGGNAAGMDYLLRHDALRRDTANVLPSAQTVISLVFSYAPQEWRDPSLPMVASYAYGLDYHDVIRRRLQHAIDSLKEIYGGDWRICIDSAPVAERYWAMRCGVGVLGKNGAVINEKCGSLGFLAEVLTSHRLCGETESEKPQIPVPRCMGCGKCIAACPTGALRGDGTVDSRKCLSYLTIEHKGEWDEEQKKTIGKSGVSPLFGCDICMRVCPHNHGIAPTGIEEFRPVAAVGSLTAEKAIELAQGDSFNAAFKGSPIKRARREGLLRNAQYLLSGTRPKVDPEGFKGL